MITFRAGSIKEDGAAIVLTIRWVANVTLVGRLGLSLIMTRLNPRYRTSGTEPKIKYYLEGQGSDRERIAGILQDVVKELREGWMQAQLHSLQEP